MENKWAEFNKREQERDIIEREMRNCLHDLYLVQKNWDNKADKVMKILLAPMYRV